MLLRPRTNSAKSLIPALGTHYQKRFSSRWEGASRITKVSPPSPHHISPSINFATVIWKQLLGCYSKPACHCAVASPCVLVICVYTNTILWLKQLFPPWRSVQSFHKELFCHLKNSSTFSAVQNILFLSPFCGLSPKVSLPVGVRVSHRIAGKI